MKDLEFSVPYNGDERLLPVLFSLKNHAGARIREVFLSGPVEHCPSGRVAFNGNLEAFSSVVERIHNEGIRVNLVVNSTCESAEWYSDGYISYLRDFMSYMVDDLGVESITLANPLIMAHVREWQPRVELCASVLGDIDCVERARVFRIAGADVATPDVSINRDLRMLKRIKEETGIELKVMVNEGCLHKCAFRKFHFNAVSHIAQNSSRVGKGLSVEEFKAQCDQVAGKTFFTSCNGLLAEDRSLLLKSDWIRPEDLGEYTKVASYFKISGRTVATHAVERMVRAYMKGSYEGDLLDIMDSSLRTFSLTKGASIDNKALGEARFFQAVENCNRNCSRCGFCDALAESVVKLGPLTDVKKSDLNFFGK